MDIFDKVIKVISGDKQNSTSTKDYWVDDNKCKACFECETPFSVFVRRHHCRICGRIFCGNCTKNFIPPPRDSVDQSWLRVCNYCHRVRQRSDHKPGASLNASLPPKGQSASASPSTTPTLQTFNSMRSTDTRTRDFGERTSDASASALSLDEPRLSSTIPPKPQTGASYRLARSNTLTAKGGDNALTWDVPSTIDSDFPWLPKDDATEGEAPQLSFQEVLRNALNVAAQTHLKDLMHQLLIAEGVGEPSAWVDLVAELATTSAATLSPEALVPYNVSDPRFYIKVKRVADYGQPSESCVVNGIVCKKNVAHRRMRACVEYPKVLLLAGALEYQRIQNKLSSFDTLLEQEKEHLRLAVARVASLKPDVLLVERSVARYAQEELLNRGISLVLNVKIELLERIARCIGTKVVPSLEQLHPTSVGFCKQFRIENLITTAKPGRGAAAATTTTAAAATAAARTLMFFDGCPRPVGCTVLLKGASLEELTKLKRVVKFACFAAYSLRLENSFLADELLAAWVASGIPSSCDGTATALAALAQLVVESSVAAAAAAAQHNYILYVSPHVTHWSSLGGPGEPSLRERMMQQRSSSMQEQRISLSSSPGSAPYSSAHHTNPTSTTTSPPPERMDASHVVQGTLTTTTVTATSTITSSSSSPPAAAAAPSPFNCSGFAANAAGQVCSTTITPTGTGNITPVGGTPLGPSPNNSIIQIESLALDLGSLPAPAPPLPSTATTPSAGGTSKLDRIFEELSEDQNTKPAHIATQSGLDLAPPRMSGGGAAAGPFAEEKPLIQVTAEEVFQDPLRRASLEEVPSGSVISVDHAAAEQDHEVATGAGGPAVLAASASGELLATEVYNLQRIFVSLGCRNTPRNMMCEPPIVKRIDYYSILDMSLADFLLAVGPASGKACQSPNCGESMVNHVRTFLFATCRLIVSTAMLPPGSTLPGEDKKQMWLWLRPKAPRLDASGGGTAPPQPVVYRVPMSPDSAAISLGQFLHLSFAAEALEVLDRSVHQDYVRYFGMGRVAVCMYEDRVCPYYMCLPGLVMHYNLHAQLKWLKQEAAELCQEANDAFDTVENALLAAATEGDVGGDVVMGALRAAMVNGVRRDRTCFLSKVMEALKSATPCPETHARGMLWDEQVMGGIMELNRLRRSLSMTLLTWAALIQDPAFLALMSSRLNLSGAPSLSNTANLVTSLSTLDTTAPAGVSDASSLFTHINAGAAAQRITIPGLDLAAEAEGRGQSGSVTAIPLSPALGQLGLNAVVDMMANFNDPGHLLEGSQALVQMVTGQSLPVDRPGSTSGPPEGAESGRVGPVGDAAPSGNRSVAGATPALSRQASFDEEVEAEGGGADDDEDSDDEEHQEFVHCLSHWMGSGAGPETLLEDDLQEYYPQQPSIDDHMPSTNLSNASSSSLGLPPPGPRALSSLGKMSPLAVAAVNMPTNVSAGTGQPQDLATLQLPTHQLDSITLSTVYSPATTIDLLDDTSRALPGEGNLSMSMRRAHTIASGQLPIVERSHSSQVRQMAGSQASVTSDPGEVSASSAADVSFSLPPPAWDRNTSATAPSLSLPSQSAFAPVSRTSFQSIQEGAVEGEEQGHQELSLALPHPSSLNTSGVERTSLNTSGGGAGLLSRSVNDSEGNLNELGKTLKTLGNLKLGRWRGDGTQTGSSNQGFGKVYVQGRSMLPVGINDTVIPIFDNEPTSIVSYMLSSRAYQQQLNGAIKSIFQAAKSSSSGAKTTGGLAAAGSGWDVGQMLQQLALPPGGTQSEVMGVRAHLQRMAEGRTEGGEQLDERDWMTLLLSREPCHVKMSFEDDAPAMPWCKTKYQVIAYYGPQFAELRRRCIQGGESAFITSLCRCRKWASRGGKSNAYFAKTRDDRFIIKGLTKVERQSFLEFGPSYFEHLACSSLSGRSSALAKIVGVYSITLKSAAGGGSGAAKDGAIDILVMENIFYDRQISRIYDLKGSERSRFNAEAAANPQDAKEVHLDDNLRRSNQAAPLLVDAASLRDMKLSLWADTAFLASLGVMDYSLLLGVDKERNELVVAVIDFVRQYTWDKQLETWVKSSGILGGNGKEPTIISPKQYMRRFRAAMTSYFTVVPNSDEIETNLDPDAP